MTPALATAEDDDPRDIAEGGICRIAALERSEKQRSRGQHAECDEIDQCQARHPACKNETPGDEREEDGGDEEKSPGLGPDQAPGDLRDDEKERIHGGDGTG